MVWNWEKKEWPNFRYKAKALSELEAQFLYEAGRFQGTIKHISSKDKEELFVELLSEEAYKSSEIEGEILNRESLQSSIKKNFGIKTKSIYTSAAEYGMAQLMTELYKNYSTPLRHKNLYQWNSLILYGKEALVKKYRDDEEPMQIVSGSLSKPKVHFEAPPSETLKEEMTAFINWFNSKDEKGLLAKAGLAHLYFVCIHPFEDGNGRIARALAEKFIYQALDEAILLSLSTVIEKQRKKYYAALDESNKNLEVTEWLLYFAETSLQALAQSQSLIDFLVKKHKFYKRVVKLLNPRQKKVVDRIFKEGTEGFKGGLSAENYISITKTSRATATRDLQDMVEKKILTKEGELKSTRYYLAI